MSKRNVLVLAVALLGCAAGPTYISQPAPSVRCAGCDSNARVAAGMPIKVQTSWSGRCEQSAADRFVRDERELESPVACGGVPYRLKLACSGPCTLFDPTTYNGPLAAQAAGTVYVVPLAPGPFTFELWLIRSDTGAADVYKSPELLVRAPDSVGLYCSVMQRVENFGDDVAVLEPCDGRPVPGERPLIQAAAELDGEKYFLHDADLNGRRDWPDKTMKLRAATYHKLRSLADLFPDRAVGGRPSAGRYEVVVSFAGQQSKVVIEVAP